MRPYCAERDLPSSMLRVLATIQDMPGPIYFTAIAGRLGWSTTSPWLQHCLAKLRRLGLVAFEDKTSGTIRLTCTIELFPEAFRDA